MKESILEVRNLCKYFPLHCKGFFQRVTGTAKAVDGVSFELTQGETLGLVGESGSGKTTAVRSILRALRPTSGQVFFRLNGVTHDLATMKERRLKRLRPKMQMVFQDPFSSLNPRMTVGGIVGEPLVIHKVAKGSELKDRIAEMLVKVGLKPHHAMRYPHAFSGGQRQRIGIARALILHPALLVADEPVSALDVSVQAQVINLLADLQEEFHLAILFVAHDLAVVKHICKRVAVMYAGRLVEVAPTDNLFDSPQHPYTRGLLSAVPYPDPDVKMRFQIPGEVADPTSLPSGCSFHPRCPNRSEMCSSFRPELSCLSGTRSVACHLYNGGSPPTSVPHH